MQNSSNIVQTLLLASIMALLVSCAGNKTKRPPAERPAQPEIQQIPSTAPHEESGPSKGSGGYYKDDGPEANPPDMSKVQDAVPVDEPLIPKLNRPYTALGKEYKPMKKVEAYKEQGIASWYGKRFHGNKTASGETYDMYKMTAAHATLPIPSYAKVTNLGNGRSVIVRINDRGPFQKDRLIDLSYAAAYKIGLLVKGSAEVEVEAVSANGKLTPSSSSSANETSKNVNKLDIKLIPAEPIADTSAPTSSNSAPGFYAQLAAFTESENAEKLKEKVVSQQIADSSKVESWYNAGKYRVRIGPFETRTEAEATVKQIKQKMGISSIIVNQK